MPKKAFSDGRVATPEEAQNMAAAWDAHETLRTRALSATPLLVAHNGLNLPMQPNLKNMAKNFEVLMEIANSMLARKRLSADPVELILEMTVAWYNKYATAYGQAKDFKLQVWAFRDAWLLHKMFTKLRGKVMKDETPKDSSLIWITLFNLHITYW